MNKELIIIYDTPSSTHKHIFNSHNLGDLLKYFDKIRVLYWSKENAPDVFEKEEGRFIFYPYKKPYSSSYIAGLAYMAWITSRLLSITNKAEKDTKQVFLAVMPLWPGLPALIISKVRGVKAILRLETHKIEYIEIEDKFRGENRVLTNLKKFVLNLFYRVTIPFFDVVIGISTALGEEAVKYGAKNVKILPVGTNNISGQFGQRKENVQIPNILYVGQIKKIKGVHNLIDAFIELSNEMPGSAKLTIAGDVTNDADARYFANLKEKSRGYNIEFLGWVNHEDLANIYRGADIFVLPSYTEALGIVIMEAMSFGLPVISSDLSGPRDLIDDGKTGFLVEPGSVKDLEKKLRILTEDTSLRNNMGASAKNKLSLFLDNAKEANNNFWGAI